MGTLIKHLFLRDNLEVPTGWLSVCDGLFYDTIIKGQKENRHDPLHLPYLLHLPHLLHLPFPISVTLPPSFPQGRPGPKNLNQCDTQVWGPSTFNLTLSATFLQLNMSPCFTASYLTDVRPQITESRKESPKLYIYGEEHYLQTTNPGPGCLKRERLWGEEDKKKRNTHCTASIPPATLIITKTIRAPKSFPFKEP